VTTWVWDASALHHAAAADRLDVLLDIAKSIPGAPSRSVTTTTVMEELTRHGRWDACGPHLEIVELETLDEVRALARWLALVSSGLRSRGEATVFAWAEVNGGPVIIDDHARKVARRNGLVAHGTLWVLVQAIESGNLRAASADALVDALRATGARLPAFPSGGIEAWARQHGLLPR
jgi:predicted nucleic acid-binding protein